MNKTTDSKTDKKRSGDKTEAGNTASETVQSTRETVESVIVAFILAFLFRAFVAEAFVIPTGSMAPTLMGAHKDLFCEYCGQQYQASASDEFESENGAFKDQLTIASNCSNCRGINKYDFVGNPNHTSFSGDRILVSKFDYVLSSPKRWDVLVFKFPESARMNYIKRLVGLPGEKLSISEGDVYTRREDSEPWLIARKPPHKIQAMKQLVSDTAHIPAVLVKQGWPSLWQPWNPGGNSQWQLTHTETQWSAKLASGASPDWLRYYHKFVDDESWEDVESGVALEPVDPKSSQLITDYLAYNTSYLLSPAKNAFELKVALPWAGPLRSVYWDPNEKINSEFRAYDFAKEEGLSVQKNRADSNDGLHWVGDLTAQFNVEIESEAGTLMVDLVEFGVHFRCSIDVATGQAKLQAIDGTNVLNAFGGAGELTGQTPVRGAGSYQIELANFDDQIVLWVNGRVVEFDQPAVYDSREFRSAAARRPYWTAADPLDAAPVGIGGVNLAMSVEQASVFRDIYYIAVPFSRSSFNDYGASRLSADASTVPDAAARANLRTNEQLISAVYANPQWWDRTELFSRRGYREYQLEDGQYFPMGDNSAASSDARVWNRQNYVEEKYLLGKALLVFWPHTWNTPVPFTPNVKRMGPIR